MNDASRSEAESDRDPDSESEGSPGEASQGGAGADGDSAGPGDVGGSVSGSAGDTSADDDATAQSAPSDRDGKPETDADIVSAGDQTEENLETLRQQVDEKYDFDKFGPDDMDRMSAEEWELSFDPDTWVTGPELLGRVEDELKSRISRREVFAVFERLGDGRILAYSDEGFVIVHPDGRIEGQGTVLEDVKPTVALCSMPEYEPPSPPEDYELPDADAVPEGTGEFGNWMIQAMAFTQLLAGVVLLGAWLLLSSLSTLIAPAMGLFFLGASLFLFATVANARLSDRFRSEEYRARLRSVQVEKPPDFVPVEARNGAEGQPTESITDSQPTQPSAGDPSDSSSADGVNSSVRAASTRPDLAPVDEPPASDVDN